MLPLARVAREQPRLKSIIIYLTKQVYVMKEGHHKVFTLFGGTKLLTSSSQVRMRFVFVFVCARDASPTTPHSDHGPSLVFVKLALSLSVL